MLLLKKLIKPLDLTSSFQEKPGTNQVKWLQKKVMKQMENVGHPVQKIAPVSNTSQGHEEQRVEGGIILDGEKDKL